MKFDRTKIKTIATAHEVEVGDYGWAEDGVASLKRQVELGTPVGVVVSIDDSLHPYPFEIGFGETKVCYKYFYPAPYELAQEAWVKENELKVGDRVRVTRTWERSELWHGSTMQGVGVGYELEVVGIVPSGIILDRCEAPYFAIEKVKEEYRPYTDEEMEELVGEVLVRNGNYPEESIRRVLVVGYSDGKIIVPSSVGNLHYDAQGVLDCFRHVTGEPAGVKL